MNEICKEKFPACSICKCKGFGRKLDHIKHYKSIYAEG